VFSTVPASSIQHPPRMFRAERASSDQSSVTANTWTKVQLNSELFDVGSCFDPTTNFRFTADVSGYYQVSFGVEFAAASGMTAIITGVYKNGAVAITGTYVPPAYATSGISSGAGLVYLDAGDYIELYALANGTTIKFKFGSSTFLSAFLIAKG
jgi:hypothetical protein